MLRKLFSPKNIRIISLFLAVFVLSGIHTETVSPQISENLQIERVGRSSYTPELPQTQRRAFTSQEREYGVADKKYRKNKTECSEQETKVTQDSFYNPVGTCHPAPVWYLVATRYGRIHSLHYA